MGRGQEGSGAGQGRRWGRPGCIVPGEQVSQCSPNPRTLPGLDLQAWANMDLYQRNCLEFDINAKAFNTSFCDI